MVSVRQRNFRACLDDYTINFNEISRGMIMGYYTEFVFAASLKEDTPDEIIDILKMVVCGPPEDVDIDVDIDHPFFKCDRWRWFGSRTSQYFGYTQPLSCVKYDQIAHQWMVSIRCSLKNYTGEIEKFVDWLMPWIEGGSGECGLLGYSIPEDGVVPTLFYLKGGSHGE